MKFSLFRLLSLSALFLIGFGCATTPKAVVVNVAVTPDIPLPEGVSKVFIGEFKGEESCTGPIMERLEMEIDKAGIFEFERDVEFIEEDVTITIKGEVTECRINDGGGSLGISFVMYYGGEIFKKKSVSKNANRPGAPASEVRSILVEKAVKEYVSLFVHTTRRELREFKTSGTNSIGVNAAMEGNWDQAIDIWTEQIKKLPNNHESLYNRGVAYEAKGGVTNLKKALKDYEAALAISKDELYILAERRAREALKSLQSSIKAKEESGL
ncbi:MAG: tetratricopeptide repeat protein [Nitrospinota bacterium]|nr:tetratricopeptide repeat protein [Nitrospinota bacterium]